MYVDSNGSIERRDIVLGRTNDKFVQIEEGIMEGERVVLNPMAIIDESESSNSQPESNDSNSSDQGS